LIDLAAQLRLLVQKAAIDTHILGTGIHNDMLDLANKIEAMQGSIVYLSSVSAASAEDALERKTTPNSQISRHYQIMEDCQRALGGFRIGRHPMTIAAAMERCNRVRSAIEERMRKKGKRSDG
jgi:hypothetical protein